LFPILSREVIYPIAATDKITGVTYACKIPFK
jgi:hypothetical protein